MVLTGDVWMARIPYNIATGFYESESLDLAAQRCVNWRPQVAQTEGATSGNVLFTTDGIDNFGSVGRRSTSRGGIVFKNELHVVNDTTLFKIDSGGLSTSIGTIEGTDRCSFATNGLNIFICDPNNKSYFYDPGFGDLQEITVVDADWSSLGQIRSVTYIDSTYIVNNDTELAQGSITDDNRGKDFKLLDFGTAEISPDPIRRVMNIRNRLHALGETTIEAFTNVGGAGFSFQRLNGSNVDKGIAARFAVTLYDDGYAYLGVGLKRGYSVYFSQATGQPKPISTSAIDVALNRYTEAEIATAFMWTYEITGNSYVGLSLPDRTFVYDSFVSALKGRPMWHERLTDGGTWSVVDCLRAYGKTLCLEDETGLIGALNTDIASEFQRDINRIATGAYINAQGAPISVFEYELLMNVGTGTFQESDEISLSLSDDGAQFFTEIETQTLGIEGDDLRRIRFFQLGTFEKTRVFKIDYNGKFKTSILDGWLNAA